MQSRYLVIKYRLTERTHWIL